MRRILAIVLACVLMAGSLTGCSGNYANKRAFTVNGTKVMMDEAMYYIFVEENTYSVYEQLYQMMYGYSFWDSTQDGTNSMSTVVKHEIVTMGAWYTILAKEAEEAGLTLTADEEAKIAEDAQSILDEITDVQKKKTGFTLEGLKKVLGKITLAGDYYVKKISEYDIDREGIRAGVSRDDYRQYDIEMLQVTFANSDGTKIDAGEQTLLKKKIDSYVADAELGKDLKGMLDDDETSISYNSLSFTSKEIGSNAMYEIASELENGKVTTYESKDDSNEPLSYYLIRMVENNSDVAYENEIRTEIKNAESEKFAEEYKDLANAAKIHASRAFDKLKLGTVTTDEQATTETTTEANKE